MFSADSIEIVGAGSTLNATQDSCPYTKSVNPRKRIYGEEYRALGEFCEPSKSKQLKLDRPEYQVVSMTNGTSADSQSSSVSSSSDPGISFRSTNRPHPTSTLKSYFKIPLTLSDIPCVCPECFAYRCCCSL